MTAGNLQLCNRIIEHPVRKHLEISLPGATNLSVTREMTSASTTESQKPIALLHRPISYISLPLWQSLFLAILSCNIGQISVFHCFWFYCFMTLEVIKLKIQSC